MTFNSKLILDLYIFYTYRNSGAMIYTFRASLSLKPYLVLSTYLVLLCEQDTHSPSDYGMMAGPINI